MAGFVNPGGPLDEGEDLLKFLEKCAIECGIKSGWIVERRYEEWSKLRHMQF